MKRILQISLIGAMILTQPAMAQGQLNNATKERQAQLQHRTNQRAIVPPRYNGVKNQQGMRANSNTQFARGKRAPYQYRQPQYFVNDWQSRNLRRPPSGYRWVRNDDNQFLLIAIATGVISQVFINENNNNYRVWGFGEYLPNRYRQNQYYVDDWRAHRLNRPSNGRRWVHVHRQYLLINIRDGQIKAVISAN